MTRWLRAAVAALGLVAVLPAAQAVPAIERWQTDNGATVLFVRTTTLPIVDVQLTFDAGSARDRDRPGLARLTSNLLLEGTEALSAGEIARRFERQGARVSTGSGRDMGRVSLRSLSEADNLDAAVSHLADVIAAPAFPADAVSRVKQQMLVGLRQDRQSASALADKAFFRALYRDHPYASPPDGTPESVRALDREAVRDFHGRYYVARNLTLAIVGDVTGKRARAIAEALTAGLPAGEAAEPLPAVPPVEAARTVRVPFDSEQVHVLMGQPAVSRDHPDYFPLYVANHVLGGNGLVSMLSEELRDKRGLSYSSYSYLAPMAQSGRFVLGTQVRSDALDEALGVIDDTLAGYRSDGPGAERLASAKTHITGSFPLKIDSNNDLVGYVGTIGFYGLPLDYLDRLPERVDAVSAERAAEAFRAHVHPERMVTVLVGPEAAIGSD